jgi:undecaprenyl-phosphate galactose phosphotransferase
MLKRIFDIFFSLLVLILLSPIFIAISLWIALSSRGGVLHISKRVGKDFQLFPCYKFRTMYQNSDALLEHYLKTHPSAQKELDTYHKLKHDPRITPIGRILRSTSLDELPQFFNALYGHISIVGPRPFTPNELSKCAHKESLPIFSVKPGITGIWQTSGRSLRTFQERLELDREYPRHSSFLFDLRIIFKTVFQMFFSYGAY